jgi:hypothetical protein
LPLSEEVFQTLTNTMKTILILCLQKTKSPPTCKNG